MINTFKNMPKGVFSLASTEMWERFSFYTMQSILVIYIYTSIQDGGLGLSVSTALKISGIYGAAVYATPVLGGWLADNFLGSKKAVAIGGILMCLGHFILASHSVTAFSTALVLLCLGCGLLKPCISSMVGECYNVGDDNRESGYSLFYMAINIGACAGSILSGKIGTSFGYHASFVMAGLGLMIGLINFYSACKTSLKNIGNKNSLEDPTFNTSNRPLTKLEKRKLSIYIFMCIANILWNVVYGLPYGILTIYADKNIDRHIFGIEVPASFFYGIYPLFIVLLSPLVSNLYTYLNAKNIPFTLNTKLAIGYFTVAIGCLILLPTVYEIQFLQSTHVGPWGLIAFYFVFSLSELFTVPVLLSAATKLAPVHYYSRMIAFNMLISWSLGAWIAGEVSAWTEDLGKGRFTMFIVLIVSCLLFAFLHKKYDKRIERLCENQEPSQGSPSLNS